MEVVASWLGCSVVLLEGDTAEIVPTGFKSTRQLQFLVSNVMGLTYFHPIHNLVQSVDPIKDRGKGKASIFLKIF